MQRPVKHIMLLLAMVALVTSCAHNATGQNPFFGGYHTDDGRALTESTADRQAMANAYLTAYGRRPSAPAAALEDPYPVPEILRDGNTQINLAYHLYGPNYNQPWRDRYWSNYQSRWSSRIPWYADSYLWHDSWWDSNYWGYGHRWNSGYYFDPWARNYVDPWDMYYDPWYYDPWYYDPYSYSHTGYYYSPWRYNGYGHHYWAYGGGSKYTVKKKATVRRGGRNRKDLSSTMASSDPRYAPVSRATTAPSTSKGEVKKARPSKGTQKAVKPAKKKSDSGRSKARKSRRKD